MAQAQARLKALDMQSCGNPKFAAFEKLGKKLVATSLGKLAIFPRALMGGSPRKELTYKIAAGAVLRIAPAQAGWQAQRHVRFLVRFDD
jgi:hypothetical protein